MNTVTWMECLRPIRTLPTQTAQGGDPMRGHNPVTRVLSLCIDRLQLEVVSYRSRATVRCTLGYEIMTKYFEKKGYPSGWGSRGGGHETTEIYCRNGGS